LFFAFSIFCRKKRIKEKYLYKFKLKTYQSDKMKTKTQERGDVDDRWENLKRMEKWSFPKDYDPNALIRENHRTVISPHIDVKADDKSIKTFEFFLKLSEEGYPQERISKDLDEEQHLVELEISDKYKQVKAEVEKNLKTPDKLKKIVAETDDPIVVAIVAETLRVTPDMPDKSVKKIVKLAENLGNYPHWFVRSRLLENEKLADGLWFRARGAGNTNIKDISENFKELIEKLKNDQDWRVRIKAIH